MLLGEREGRVWRELGGELASEFFGCGSAWGKEKHRAEASAEGAGDPTGPAFSSQRAVWAGEILKIDLMQRTGSLIVSDKDRIPADAAEPFDYGGWV